MIILEEFLRDLKNIDYLLLILSLIFILLSTFKGFVKSILGIFTWIGAILISIYFHEYLNILIINQLSKWELLAKNLPINNISKYIIAIPLIFIISLFLLRRLRNFITSDLNNSYLGKLADKFFGFIFGLFFSYIVFSTILISPTLIKFNWYKENIILPLQENSKILDEVANINKKLNPQTINTIDIVE